MCTSKQHRLTDLQSDPQDANQARQMKKAFRMVAGKDMEVDAYELQGILNAAFKKGISLDYHISVVVIKPQSQSLLTITIIHTNINYINY